VTGSLPPALAACPRLSQWVRVRPDGIVEVWAGKAELGQGILTALAQVVAEELDVDVTRVRAAAPTTSHGPDAGYTAGSLSVQQCAPALRQVCAQVRGQLLAAAAQRLGPGKLTVRDGAVRAPNGDQVSYWELAPDVSLETDADGRSAPKDPGTYTVVGTSVPRMDLADKLAGRPRFVHDLRWDGMLYGRVLRPPSLGAVLTSADTAAAEAGQGVVGVLVDGSFVGAVAVDEAGALAAVQALHEGTTWSEPDVLPDADALAEFLCTAPAERTVLLDAGPTTAPTPARPARTLAATFTRPFLAHASIAPSASVARWDHEGRSVEVWTHSQGVHPLRRDIACALGVEPEHVTVHHAEGAGCYGHNAADDAAYDAVLLAGTVPGRHVQVVWSRRDELGWAPFGPAMRVDLTAEVGDDGRLSRWTHDGWGNGHTSRPGALDSPSLLAFAHQKGGRPIPAAQDPPPERGGGLGRNAVPGYEIPIVRAQTHRLLAMPLRTSALRSLGAHLNVFAIESFMDELAQVAGADPLDFRLAHLGDERARAVLEAVATAAGWGTPMPAGEHPAGRGLGFARYKGSGAWCAVVAEVIAEQQLQVRRLTIAVDVGLVLNPDGVVNQIEGGAVQAASWTLKERVRFDRRRVLSDTWETYPIMSFGEVPPVDVLIVPRPDQPPLGAGEASVGPTAAAIGNALYAALGVRVRDLPLTPEAIIAAIDGQ
jgi:nicotinate dehydrogenase subunit B